MRSHRLYGRAIAFQIKSGNVAQGKFTEALKDLGLGGPDIEKIESRIEVKSGLTGTYLVDGQSFGFNSDDGIDQVLLRNLAGGFTPPSGEYKVARAAGEDAHTGDILTAAV